VVAADGRIEPCADLDQPFGGNAKASPYWRTMTSSRASAGMKGLNSSCRDQWVVPSAE
jgi:hypothetical protein